MQPAITAVLALETLLLLIYLIDRIRRVDSGTTREAREMKIVKHLIAISSSLLGCMSVISSILGSSDACYWTMKIIFVLYTSFKLLFYLFLLIRSRIVQNVGRCPPGLSGRFQTCLSWVVIIALPAIIVLSGVVIHGERSIAQTCAFVVPYRLESVIFSLDTVLNVGFIITFTLSLKEAERTLVVFQRDGMRHCSRVDLYRKLMRRHLVFTFIGVTGSALAMLLLTLQHYTQRIRPFVLPICVTDCAISTLLTYLMSNRSGRVLDTPTSTPPMSILPIVSPRTSLVRGSLEMMRLKRLPPLRFISSTVVSNLSTPQSRNNTPKELYPVIEIAPGRVVDS